MIWKLKVYACVLTVILCSGRSILFGLKMSALRSLDKILTQRRETLQGSLSKLRESRRRSRIYFKSQGNLMSHRVVWKDGELKEYFYGMSIHPVQQDNRDPTDGLSGNR